MHFMQSGPLELEEVKCSSDSAVNQANNCEISTEKHSDVTKVRNPDLESFCLENNLNESSISGSGTAESQEPELNANLRSGNSAPSLNSAEKQFQSRIPSSGSTFPSIGMGKPFPPPLPNREPYAVDFSGPDDPESPQNWTSLKKKLISSALNFSALSISIASASYAEGISDIEKEFGVGSTVATLGTSFFVFGFSAGPVIWGPFSELYGRKPVLVVSAFGMFCFSLAVATAKDIQTVLIGRFFSGFMGASALVAAPAALADMYPKHTRGIAMIHFGWIMLGASMVGPIVGGFTVKNTQLGWRFCSWISVFIEIAVLAALLVFVDETHHGIILAKKAEKLRKETGNWGIYAPHELVSLSLKEIAEKTLQRPLLMLYTEPILFLLALYIAFIYGLMYMYLTAIPLIFSDNYGFPQGVAQLPYISMLVGVLLGSILLYFMEKQSARRNRHCTTPNPEEKLPPMMIGGILFAIGLFWLGWTGSYPHKIHWIVPTMGAAPIGAGILLVFIPTTTYIIESYLAVAASALAGNTFLRSLFGGGFPLFAEQMFLNLGIKWASTLLGCIALVLVPVPFAFYKYGRQIRLRSKYVR